MRGDFATAVDLLREAAQRFGEREAFVDGDRRLTFGEWDRAADGLAAAMSDMGVTRGDVVCLVLPSSVDYAIAYQGAMRLGAITSGVNPRLGPSEKASVFARSAPTLTVHDETFAPAASLPGGSARLLEVRQLPSLCTADPLPAARRANLDERDVVAVVWTSGTTGAPKGAMFDHRNLRAMARAAGDLTRPFDRKLSPLPFAHIGYMTRPWDEISNIVTTIISPTPWRADETLRLLERERITLCQGVPTQYHLLLSHPDFDTTDLSSIRLVGCGSARVPPELVREMRERFRAPVMVRYASTETSVCTGTFLDDDDETIANTVGRAGGGVEVVLTDDDGQPVPIGEVGTVRVRSAAQMLGYWRDPARTAESISPEGWIVTGDLGRFDNRGVLTLVGRRTEMYIRSGYNVYPAELENFLGDHPDIGAIAVTGVPAPVVGEIGVAWVVPTASSAYAATPVGTILNKGDAGLCDSLRSVVRDGLADYKAPEHVVIVDVLPVTSMMKVDKRALVAKWVDLGR